MPILQPPVPSAPPISSASSTTPKEINLSSSPPTSTFMFDGSDITTNVTKKLPQAPLVVQSQDRLSKKLQSYPHLQHDKINSSTPTPQISKKEEHTKKLKAAFEEQQRALRIAYEKSLQDAQEWDEKTPPSNPSSKASNAAVDSERPKPVTGAKSIANHSKPSLNTISPADQLQRSYMAHLASLQRAEQESSSKAISMSSLATSSQSKAAETDKAKTEGNENTTKKKAQDEEAGAILLGFLNSLRESFEDAIEDKDRKNEPKERIISSTRNMKVSTHDDDDDTEMVPTTIVQLGSSIVVAEESSESIIHVSKRRNGNDNERLNTSIKSRRKASDSRTSLSHFQSSKRKVKPASITETSSSTSSQPTIEQPLSSQDSKSDKMDHSSSEDSDKEITASIRRSKGPPRKRMKGFHEPHEFTRENLMAHSKRMDMECGQSSDVSSDD